MRLAFLSLQQRRIPLHAGIVAAVLAVCLLLIGLDGWRTWQLRQTVITADRTETANLARSLAQQAHDTFYVADVILSDLRERIETDGLSPKPLDRLQHIIVRRLHDVPTLSGLALFDAAGRLVAGEQNPAHGPFTVEDRFYFRYHSSHPDRGVLVGEVIRSRADGQWSITASRRVDDAQGRFAGVVRARISVASLQRFYRSFVIGPLGAISLVSMDGVVVARTDGAKANIGANVASGQAFRSINAGQMSGSIGSVSPVDGVRRLGSFRRVDDYPLYIVVAHALDEVLAKWRADAARHLAISLLVSTVLVVAGSRFARQVRIRQQAEQRYRLLAENLSDAIVCIGLDGRRFYVSPAFTVLTGWSAEEVVATRAIDIIHPADRSLTATMLPQLLTGTALVTQCFRYICKNGSLLWVETRSRLLRSSNGEVQVISNVRDITERREAEAQLALLNRELAEQANTDGLTGLANRRRFDDALAQGWRRALREEVPLSLLMIDVDRFKLFNDRNGHQRGDDCLRAVATVVAQVAYRSAGLTARYGGEEFVVLLPGVDQAGAAALANRMLVAVRAAGIEHEDNIPAGVVTVSIGAATAAPSADMTASDLTGLIAGADAALYEAKRSGRNCVVTQADTLSCYVRRAAIPV